MGKFLWTVVIEELKIMILTHIKSIIQALLFLVLMLDKSLNYEDI
jgi:hypothetical protein